MAAEKSKTPRRKKSDKRETGIAGQSGNAKTPQSHTLPPDPPTIGRPMTQGEKVDEASLESMDASDPPAHSSSARSGGPKRPEDMTDVPDEDAIRRRAYALWEADGRPHGRDDEYWHRAERALHGHKSKPA
jgi:Protein of unknown function (DUF2934)